MLVEVPDEQHVYIRIHQMLKKVKVSSGYVLNLINDELIVILCDAGFKLFYNALPLQKESQPITIEVFIGRKIITRISLP